MQRLSESESWPDDGMPNIRDMIAAGIPLEVAMDAAEFAWAIFSQTEPNGFRFHRLMIDIDAIQSVARH